MAPASVGECWLAKMNDQALHHFVMATSVIDDYLPLPSTIEDLTFTSLLIVLVVAFVRGWIVPGSRETKQEERLDKVTEALNKLSDGVERTLDVNEELMKRLDRNA